MLEAELSSTQPVAIDECIAHSVLNAILAIARNLLKNKAVLLSDTHEKLACSLAKIPKHSQNTKTVTVSKRAFHKHLMILQQWAHILLYQDFVDVNVLSCSYGHLPLGGLEYLTETLAR